MATPIFTGSAVAVVTPFTDTGVDFAKLEQLVEFHIKNKTDAIVICGSTGEASTMPDEEHLAAIKCCVDTVAGRVPVIAGTGSNDTNHGINLTRRAIESGVDAVLVVTPYYNKCTPEGLYRHYSAIAANADAPIILYNVPSRTNVNIGADVLYRLADIENIVGIKECNLSQVPEIISRVGDRFDLYSGEDALVVPLLSLGGKGVISVMANLIPEYTHNIVSTFMSGDIAGAAKLQCAAIPLVKALFSEVNPIPVKEALNILGANVGPCRLPLCEMSPAGHDKLVQVLADYDTSALTEFFA